MHPERQPLATFAWQTSRFSIALGTPRVMGIVNVTPDSFSDGGRDVQGGIVHCEQLLRDGADILDIGGESTRPGSLPPTLEEELARVLPVVRHAVTLGVPVSVDTSRAEVMRAALDMGADIINDIRALQSPGAMQVVAQHAKAGVCLMHMAGDPSTMQQQALARGAEASPRAGSIPSRNDGQPAIVGDVVAFLRARIDVVQAHGVVLERVVVDPGIGFGKTVPENMALLQHQAALAVLRCPVLVGWSRKSTLGTLTGRPVADRLPASLAAALAAVRAGAHIIRVHDVAATVDALKVWRAAGMA
jgi:dihydropteroate synthase